MGPKSANWTVIETLEFTEEELPWEPLQEGLRSHIKALKKSPRVLKFGPVTIASVDLAQALQNALTESLSHEDPQRRFLEILRTSFYGLKPPPYGREDSTHFVTGYFQPTYRASRSPQEGRTQALYRKPEELVAIDLAGFAKVWGSESFPKAVRARGRVERGRVVPFDSREQIDRQGSLTGKSLELAYVDPIDAFFLQIQGSGRLVFDDGSTFWVGYADQNGRPYFAVGRLLRDHISAEQMGMKALRQHMEALRPRELQKLLSQNGSYVFFEKRQDQSLGSYGLPPVAARTVAVDPSHLSLGGVGLLTLEGATRLVLFQDTGGAIKGARLDLFTGQGETAGQVAGELKAPAELLVLLPRSDLP